MAQSFVGLVSVLVPCYDAAIEYYCDSLGFHLVQDDRVSPEKRWVVVKPDPLAECGRFWPKQQMTHNLRISANKPAGAYFCFYSQTTFTAHIVLSWTVAWNF